MFGVIFNMLGYDFELWKDMLVNMLDGYMKNDGMYLNINVFNKDILIDV